MTLVEFLTARLDEDGANLLRLVDPLEFVDESCTTRWGERVAAEMAAKRAIIEAHELWPVLVETPPKMEPVQAGDLNTVTYRMSQQIEWQTQQEYRARFGTEPPTAPMLRHLAAIYADHPDYDPAWRP